MSRPNPNIRCVSPAVRGEGGQWIDISKGPATQYIDFGMHANDRETLRRAAQLEAAMINTIRNGARDLQALKELGDCYADAGIRIGRQPDDPCRNATITGAELARLFFHSCTRAAPHKPH